LNILDKGIYQSIDDDNDYYVEIPKYLDWDEFRTYTFEIKNNISDTNYDIAKGIFYLDGRIVEILRIVKPNATIKFLKLVQQKYIDKLH
jgi:hypothetical protein